jgi:coenzyme F420 biosynthesis associated uncharacterized protein
MSPHLVDWRLAERIAVAVAGGDDAGSHPAILRDERLRETCSEALGLVLGYSRLEPGAKIPPGEPVDRAGWSRGVLATVRGFADELAGLGSVEVSLPGPLGRIARSFVGAGAATEVGLAAGYAARRVLGQYELALVGPERPPRLLFVAPNVIEAAAKLEVDLERFTRWVALHETTHAVQFSAASWLRDHLGGLIRELLRGAAEHISVGELARRLARDPRGAVSSFLRGDMAKALVGPEQAPALDRIQAAMTVIEGHAEHVMDAAGPEFVGDVEGLRRKLEDRRARRGPLEIVIGRLLGMDLKLRQYELGKRFCDAVVAEAGIVGLNRAWAGPESLPTLEELNKPSAWLDRVLQGMGAGRRSQRANTPCGYKPHSPGAKLQT